MKDGVGPSVNRVNLPPPSRPLSPSSEGAFRVILVSILLLWTLLIALALWWNLRDARQTTEYLAQVAARSSFEKDLIYRQWAAMHGGVYVPVTERTPPNPYLSGAAERDITTPSGKKLTLMNPAYMTRQVHELGKEHYRHTGHITSLKPIRPENAPDDWERKALEAFERGVPEVSSIVTMDGERFLRFMRPMRTDAACLKCHEAQGYKEGDVRGGISVAVPMRDYEAIVAPHRRAELLAHGLIWVLGVFLITVGGWQVQRRRRERDSASVALRESEGRYRNLVEGTADLVTSVDREGRMTFANAMAQRVFGLTPNECMGRLAFDFIHPDDRAATETWFRKVQASREPVGVIENRQVHRDGSVRLLLWKCTFHYDDDGRCSQIDGIARDITELKRQETQLQLTRGLLQKTSDSLYVIEPESRRLIDINETACLQLGYTQEELLRSRVEDIDPAFPIDRWAEHVEAVRAKEDGVLLETTHQRKDGTRFPVEVNVRYVRMGDRDYMVAGARDISERNRTEEALRVSEARSRAILEALPDFLFRLSREGVHLDFHAPSPERLYVDPKDFMGKRVQDVLPAAIADQYLFHIGETLSTSTPQLFDYELSFSENDRRSYEARMTCSGADEVLVIVREITELKQAQQRRVELEDQLQQAQKMEALGQLAGGIAHDFNNQLSVIIGYAELIEANTKDLTIRAYARHVLGSSEHSAELTQQLLAFARKGQYVAKPVDIHVQLNETADVLERSLSKSIRIHRQLDAERSVILGDGSLLQNAFFNLAINARDAMPDGGELNFVTRTVELSADRAARIQADLRAGTYLHVSVRDTGSGMSEETQRRIFEPFFTTKAEGEGTGLGLAAVYGTIVRHGGGICVESKLGEGSTFHVYLPLAACDGPRSSMPEVGAGEMSQRVGGHILVVEDELAVRELLSEVLTDLGCRVSTANDGAAAVEWFSREWRDVDLVILDMNMPNMNGLEAFSAMHETNPEVRVIVASGYSAEGMVKAAMDRGAVAFLPKPFRKLEVIAAVRKVLDEKRS